MPHEDSPHFAFGPVPSRRLGHSLGVNPIPYKTCTYSCVYCQVGRTRTRCVEPTRLSRPEAVAEAVRARLREARDSGDFVDYLTFVPDGEPTLDESLGRTIGLLRPLGVPIAIITNGSLVDRPEVREGLLQADWVSFKVDAADEDTWRRINRPHDDLRLPVMLEGMVAFRKRFQGTVVTETMLVRGLNDGDKNVASVAQFVGRLNPAAAFLSIPTRPPAEPWALPPREDVLARAFQVFNARVRHTEYLIGYEGNAFACSGDPEQDLLAITAVHPMRKEAVDELLRTTGADWEVVRLLVDGDRLVETEYESHTYYLRKFPRKGAPWGA